MCEDRNACEQGLENAREHLGHSFPVDKPVSLASLIEVLGVFDIVWILGNVLEEREILVEFAIWNAESVLPVFEKKFPDDKRPREAIEAAKSGDIERCRRAARGVAGAAEALEDVRVTAGTAREAARAARAAEAVWAAGWAARTVRAAEAVWAVRAVDADPQMKDKQIAWLKERLT